MAQALFDTEGQEVPPDTSKEVYTAVEHLITNTASPEFTQALREANVLSSTFAADIIAAFQTGEFLPFFNPPSFEVEQSEAASVEAHILPVSPSVPSQSLPTHPDVVMRDRGDSDAMTPPAKRFRSGPQASPHFMPQIPAPSFDIGENSPPRAQVSKVPLPQPIASSSSFDPEHPSGFSLSSQVSSSSLRSSSKSELRRKKSLVTKAKKTR